MNPDAFRQLVLDYYTAHPRHLPWRESVDPYEILVSEIMLQQTQVERVIPKYQAFLRELPTAFALANAEQTALLRLWSGLGYNRRALNLQRAAQQIVASGGMPTTREGLRALPGVGEYTSGAVMAFAYNQPVVLIETNIRRALIHHFFPDSDQVADAALLPIIEQVLYRESPRIWYWAFMDYGSYLGRTLPNANRRSKHYTVQSPFKGSHRQLRGALLRVVSEGRDPESLQAIAQLTGRDPEEVATAIRQLEAEGFHVSSLLATLN
jgi:A/G-specific adenine glycosylase